METSFSFDQNEGISLSISLSPEAVLVGGAIILAGLAGYQLALRQQRTKPLEEEDSKPMQDIPTFMSSDISCISRRSFPVACYRDYARHEDDEVQHEEPLEEEEVREEVGSENVEAEPEDECDGADELKETPKHLESSPIIGEEPLKDECSAPEDPEKAPQELECSPIVSEEDCEATEDREELLQTSSSTAVLEVELEKDTSEEPEDAPQLSEPSPEEASQHPEPSALQEEMEFEYSDESYYEEITVQSEEPTLDNSYDEVTVTTLGQAASYDEITVNTLGQAVSYEEITVADESYYEEITVTTRQPQSSYEEVTVTTLGLPRSIYEEITVATETPNLFSSDHSVTTCPSDEESTAGLSLNAEASVCGSDITDSDWGDISKSSSFDPLRMYGVELNASKYFMNSHPLKQKAPPPNRAILDPLLGPQDDSMSDDESLTLLDEVKSRHESAQIERQKTSRSICAGKMPEIASTSSHSETFGETDSSDEPVEPSESEVSKRLDVVVHVSTDDYSEQKQPHAKCIASGSFEDSESSEDEDSFIANFLSGAYTEKKTALQNEKPARNSRYSYYRNLLKN